MARVVPVNLPPSSDDGPAAPLDLPAPPPGVSAESRDLVAALVRERALYADDAELKRMAGELLASGRPTHVVAELLGLRAATVWGWMADPDVRRAKRQGVEYLRARVAEEMVEGMLDAAQAVRQIVTDATVDPEVRLSAFRELADRTGFGVVGGKQGSTALPDGGFRRRLALVVGGAGNEVGETEDDEEEAEEEGGEFG